MKLWRAAGLFLVAARPAAGNLRSLAVSLGPDALGDDQTSLDSVLGQIEGRAGSPAAPSGAGETASDDLESSGLLANAQWPARDAWDKSFADVLTGATASPCSTPLLGRARLSPYGFGAHLNQFANEVALAMYAGQPLALCAPPQVRDEWAQHFQDPGFSRCDTCDWGNGPRRYRQMTWDLNRRDGEDQEQVVGIKHFVYQKLFALKPDVQSKVDAAVGSLALGDGPYVGVHIRYGDKSQEVPPVPIEKYAEAATKLCREMGTRTVFLASDDAQARSMLQGFLGTSFSVVEQPRLPAADYQLRGDAARALHPGDGVEEEETSVLVDVAALVRSAAFVGTASSNIDRLVYFQRDPGAPAVSLDEGGTDGFLAIQGQR